MRVVSFILFIVLISGCASVTSPGGGPRDEQPPRVIYSDPPDQTVNFTGKQIILEFDEYVEVKDVKEQLLVTPRLKEDVEAITKRKKVILSFNEELLPNTTYSLNFRESIRDITENNPAENLRFAFSTGNFIDSAYIEGSVYGLMKDEPMPSLVVGVYPAEDTTSILNDPPQYMTISTEDGSFRLENMRAGSYRIYALADGNKDSMLDAGDESYGFLSDTLSLDTGISQLRIPVLKNDIRDTELRSARSSGKYFQARYNKYISDYRVEGDDSLTHNLVENNTIIKFYNTIESDSIPIVVTVFDTIGRESSDSIMLKFNESPRAYDEYKVRIDVDPVISTRKILRGSIHPSKPSVRLVADSMFFFIDSVRHIIPDSLLAWKEHNNRLELEADLSYYLTDSSLFQQMFLMLQENSLLSVDGDSSETVTKKLQWVPLEQSGNIEVEVIPGSSGYFVQLLNREYKVIREQANLNKVNFSYLAPGTYMIRVLVDTNNNGKWDPGDILQGIMPEPVILYRESDGEPEMELKANWILGPKEIDLSNL